MQLRRLVDYGFMLVGPLFILANIAYRASTYGTKWVFGTWWLPQTILAPDGRHYPNGEWIEPEVLYLVQTGLEPVAYLIGFILVILMSCFLGYLYWNLERCKRRLEEAQRLYPRRRQPR